MIQLSVTYMDLLFLHLYGSKLSYFRDGSEGVSFAFGVEDAPNYAQNEVLMFCFPAVVATVLCSLHEQKRINETTFALKKKKDMLPINSIILKNRHSFCEVKRIVRFLPCMITTSMDWC
ncbi:hypothetical protein VPH35_096353 [Triticum aestivum]